ncbi:ABC transporter permease [Pyrodictium abyssi]|uniref:ABC transporter permease n=1 Tax=Pyrodictium abyssi TaxID=54256 RepID=A0ABM8IYW6_9CREN|nr:ABC transporter permease [Pyrodictium abyssi]
MTGNELAEIALRSLYVSGTATLLAALWSLPLAYVMATGRKLQAVAAVTEALVGVPTVLVGLLLYFLLSRQGPLGFLNLLYTPTAIIVGEAVLVTPLLVSVAYRVLRGAVETYGELALSLGASEAQAMALAVREAAPGLVAALVMGFSRAVGELGVALMIGGNIRGYTRTLTTAIALEVSKGEFENAVSLGAVLVAIMVVVSLGLRLVRRLGQP